MQLFSLVGEKPKIYSVSELNYELKDLLEKQFGQVWLAGEISNFKAHSSGHYYFTLKDKSSTLNAVMFKGANRRLRFKMDDGLQVVAMGRISLYEPMGKYQIVLEHVEPAGIGALQLAFDQLKAKLAAEGLFEPERKKTIPKMVRTVGVITSPTGAVIKDILSVLKRRDPRIKVLLCPVHVQGELAVTEICDAIALLNDAALTHMQYKPDVLIVGRGGGSLEDLWAFNSEALARAIAASGIPIISAVGHETDYTIADFVADLRAPTPSAAAELISQDQQELRRNLQTLASRMLRAMLAKIAYLRQQLDWLQKQLKHPKNKLQELAQTRDLLSQRLVREMQFLLQKHISRLQHLSASLELLSPLAVLARGYSLTYIKNADGSLQLIKSIGQVTKDTVLISQLSDRIISSKVV